MKSAAEIEIEMAQRENDLVKALQALIDNGKAKAGHAARWQLAKSEARKLI